MFGQRSFNISVRKLKGAKPENLKRLADSLKLNTDGMSHRQIARLIRWRITRSQARFNNPQKRRDYESVWENF
jgi:hypothetical protein